MGGVSCDGRGFVQWRTTRRALIVSIGSEHAGDSRAVLRSPIVRGIGEPYGPNRSDANTGGDADSQCIATAYDDSAHGAPLMARPFI